MARAAGLTKQKLAELAKKYNDREIGGMFGVGPQAIQKRRVKAGIAPFQKRGALRTFDPDPKELHSLYQEMPAKAIAERYGVGETVVWSRLQEHGITVDASPDYGHRRKPGSQHSLAHLEAIRSAAKARRGKYVGERNPNWKGGISGVARHGRNNSDHAYWKKRVLAKAGYKCERCGIAQDHYCSCCGQYVRLHVHHKLHYRSHPELRYEDSNGEALCATCHYHEHFR